VALASGNGGIDRSFVATDRFGASDSSGGWTSQNLYPRAVGDVNGDGRGEIVGFGEAATFAVFGDATFSFGAFNELTDGYSRTSGFGGWTSQDRYLRMLADVNGDRRADIIGLAHTGTFVTHLYTW
jgi:hypothetical protein